jgi:hypothetical protein
LHDQETKENAHTWTGSTCAYHQQSLSYPFSGCTRVRWDRFSKSLQACWKSLISQLYLFHHSVGIVRKLRKGFLTFLEDEHLTAQTLSYEFLKDQTRQIIAEWGTAQIKLWLKTMCYRGPDLTILLCQLPFWLWVKDHNWCSEGWVLRRLALSDPQNTVWHQLQDLSSLSLNLLCYYCCIFHIS